MQVNIGDRIKLLTRITANDKEIVFRKGSIFYVTELSDKTITMISNNKKYSFVAPLDFVEDGVFLITNRSVPKKAALEIDKEEVKYFVF